MNTGKRRWYSLNKGLPPGSPPTRTVRYLRSRAGSNRLVQVLVSFSLPGFWLWRAQDDSDFDRLDFPHARVLGAPETPHLPEDVFYLAIPEDAVLMNVSKQIVPGCEQLLEGTYRIASISPPRLESAALGLTPGKRASQASEAYHPNEVVRIATAGSVAGIARIVVQIRPFAYIPSSGRLSVRHSIEFRLDYRPQGNGGYRSANVDIGSPLLSNLLGAQQVLHL